MWWSFFWAFKTRFWCEFKPDKLLYVIETTYSLNEIEFAQPPARV